MNMTKSEIIECCKVLEARRLNGGSWATKGKCPDCILKVADQLDSSGESVSRIFVAETYIRSEAVRLVAESMGKE